MNDEPRIENTNESAPAVNIEQSVEASVVQAEAKKKSNAGRNVAIIILVWLLGIATAVIVLAVTGALHFEKMFSADTEGNSGGTSNNIVPTGKYGGISDDSADPTVEKAKAVCESHDNYEWRNRTEDMIGSIARSDTSFREGVVGIYTCDIRQDNGPNAGKSFGEFEYQIVVTKDNFRDIPFYMKQIEGDHSKDDVYEQSDSFYKIGRSFTSTYYYSVAYKNFAIDLQVRDKDNGHKMLADMGFPDRSYTIK